MVIARFLCYTKCLHLSSQVVKDYKIRKLVTINAHTARTVNRTGSAQASLKKKNDVCRLIDRFRHFANDFR